MAVCHLKDVEAQSAFIYYLRGIGKNSQSSKGLWEVRKHSLQGQWNYFSSSLLSGLPCPGAHSGEPALPRWPECGLLLGVALT